MRLADFILSNMESILVEWERFASTLLPAAVSMTALALRNETRQAQIDKSLGRAPKVMGAPATAAQTHAILRARSGFDINQLASEYRALRASVLNLWTEACQLGEINLEDVIRFNEAIDQALAESVQFLANKWSGRANRFSRRISNPNHSQLAENWVAKQQTLKTLQQRHRLKGICR